MEKTNKRSVHTKQLVLLALLSAIVAVLAYYGGFIKIGSLASISLTLIPVVIGATLCGPLAGAWLGGVAAVMFFATPDAAFWLGLSVPGTIITVMVKGVLSGLCAGLAYRLLARFNRYLAVVVSAIVCPVVNTGIFLLGSVIFFMDTVSGGAAAEGVSVGMYLIVFFVGLNFVFELITNIAVSPAIVRILDIAQKKQKK
ncbi:MAG: ECF transporter S component [Clostridia bacterium]|nr:ECF transporter S component [Clostridia bacterium]